MHDFLQLVPASLIWRALTVCTLLALAFQFGRTLLQDKMPLIEQIARVGRPDLPEALRRYTRRLTLLWFVYLVSAALFLLFAGTYQALSTISIGLTTMILFIGEHRLRKRIFPDENFPSILQQISDTAACFKQRNN